MQGTDFSEEKSLKVTAEAERRIDLYLAETLKVSRSRVQLWIKSQNVKVNARIAKKKDIVRCGDVITYIPLQNPYEKQITPEPIKLDVVYEDEYLLLLNKPPGMVVHPAPGNYSGTVMHGLMWHTTSLSDLGGTLRFGIVHRLDKNTSGLMMVAKNNDVHAILSEMLCNREVYKEYRTLCWGLWNPAHRKIQEPLTRDRFHRKKMRVGIYGKEAVTHVEVLKTIMWATYLKVVLCTGRTHQIRVHLSYAGHPVVGDETYGGRAKSLKRVDPLYKGRAQNVLENLDRQFLHARILRFVHPVLKKDMNFECDLPEDLKAVCRMEGIDFTY